MLSYQCSTTVSLETYPLKSTHHRFSYLRFEGRLLFFSAAYGSRKSSSSKSNSSQENQYYCEICDKKLNGPIPYEVHLKSKAHKEELEVREEFNY